MYLPIEPQATRAKTWLAAVQAVNALKGKEALNVVMDIAEPLSSGHEDDAVEGLVDAYLRLNKCMPLRSVANTIFPLALYRRHGSPKFYSVYNDKVFPRLRRAPNDWGRYFDRLTRFIPANSKEINPLDNLITKMRDQLESDQTYKNIYELNIYDPVKDAGRLKGRQCLSFLSFKLNVEHQLCLTAIYRNHYYTERLLGNMMGLGDLMAFVAGQTGTSVGPLTIMSTHAFVDCPGSRSSLEELHASCSKLIKSASSCVASGYEQGVTA